MGEAPDDEPDDSPRRLTRRRIIVLAVVGSLVLVGVVVGVAVWQLRDDPPALTEQGPPTLTEQGPPTLIEQVAAVPGMSEEQAARLVDNLQSKSVKMAILINECEAGTSVRGFGALATAGGDFPPGRREVVASAWEVMYKYYCPDAVGS